MTETHPRATALQIATEILGMTEAEFRGDGARFVDFTGNIVLNNAEARRILAAFAKLAEQVPEPGGATLSHAEASEVIGYCERMAKVYAATGDKVSADEAQDFAAKIQTGMLS